MALQYQYRNFTERVSRLVSNIEIYPVSFIRIYAFKGPNIEILPPRAINHHVWKDYTFYSGFVHTVMSALKTVLNGQIQWLFKILLYAHMVKAAAMLHITVTHIACLWAHSEAAERLFWWIEDALHSWVLHHTAKVGSGNHHRMYHFCDPVRSSHEPGGQVCGETQPWPSYSISIRPSPARAFIDHPTVTA